MIGHAPVPAPRRRSNGFAPFGRSRARFARPPLTFGCPVLAAKCVAALLRRRSLARGPRPRPLGAPVAAPFGRKRRGCVAGGARGWPFGPLRRACSLAPVSAVPALLGRSARSRSGSLGCAAKKRRSGPAQNAARGFPRLRLSPGAPLRGLMPRAPGVALPFARCAAATSPAAFFAPRNSARCISGACAPSVLPLRSGRSPRGNARCASPAAALASLGAGTGVPARLRW